MPIDERILFRITYLYLEKFLNKSNISKRLRLTPRTVKNYLEVAKKKKARQNYINIDINTDERYKYELLLIDKYDLLDVILVEDHDEPETVSEYIGIEVSKFVSQAIRKIYKKNKQVIITLGHGEIIKTLVNKLTGSPRIPLTICGIVNDPSEELATDKPIPIDARVVSLTNQLRGKFHRQPITDKEDVYLFPRKIPMNKEEHHALLHSNKSQRTLKKLRKSNILIFGVGGFSHETMFYKTADYYGKKEGKSYIAEFKAKKCVGALGGSIPIDDGGNRIRTDFDHHFIGLELSETERIARSKQKYSIAVGHGERRAIAIRETIKNHKYANVLATNLATGKILLDL